MHKMQILFPEPMMRQLKEQAAAEDRPVSEIVRQAVEQALRRKGGRKRQIKAFPTFQGGRVLTSAEDLKSEIYRDDR